MTYRVLVTGSRAWGNQSLLGAVLAGVRTRHPHLVVVHGAGPGADSHAAHWCRRNGVEQEPHRAKWTEFGHAAGPIRNAEMVACGADACIAFKDDFVLYGKGGTEDCVRKAKTQGIPCWLHTNTTGPERL